MPELNGPVYASFLILGAANLVPWMTFLSLADYFAFRYGGVRFICVDTETGGLEDPAGEQQQWLVAELEAASADPDIRFAVVCLSTAPRLPMNATIR